ncbi:MAG: thiol reductant ABC exporter subunit CydD [Natronospirillum sp.]|uniref:thiol reductant ABC exporter subunit CydD n=1 Tax=Natronospirillum sp. TaxID=2812955 RepID=UPI0025D39B31|nr:thiol reductant ABC exporter subunit CydD [Natronospirillum sp.]MCH8552130.1 thiol reductant ABC exporter subunit CydD [Natronospirillum sp.]
MATIDTSDTRSDVTPRRWLDAQRRHDGGAGRRALLAGASNGLFILLQMALIAWLVQSAVVQYAEPATLIWPALALIPVLLGRSLTQAWQETAGQQASQRVRSTVREQLLRRWAELGPVRLAGSSPAGLASQMVEQVEALDGYYARFLPQMWICVLVPLAILLLVFSLDWLAALFLLLAAPLIPLFMALVGMGAEKLNQQHFQLVQRLAGHFTDRIRGMTTLHLFGQTRSATGQVAAAADQYRRLNLRTLRVAFLSSAVLEFFASVAIAVLAIYIGFGLLGYIDWGPATELTLFTGLLILLLAPEFFQPLRTLAQHYHDRAAALGAAEQLMRLLASASEAPVERKATAAAEGNAPAVDLRGVTFGHKGRNPVCTDLNLTIERGELLALAGPSGSGKSTLLQLMAGFLQPDAGQVTIFGQPAGEQPMAWMDQRPCLIQGTWAENLRLTAPGASIEQMQDALRKTGLESLLNTQPDGLDTPLGEGGRGLSGGQARRLALARVFLAPAQLVLLDEPTTGLDAVSEAHIIQGLQQLIAEGRTLVVATHHPQLLEASSRTVRLELPRPVSEEPGHETE